MQNCFLVTSCCWLSVSTHSLTCCQLFVDMSCRKVRLCSSSRNHFGVIVHPHQKQKEASYSIVRVPHIGQCVWLSVCHLLPPKLSASLCSTYLSIRRDGSLIGPCQWVLFIEWACGGECGKCVTPNILLNRRADDDIMWGKGGSFG